MLCIKCFAVLSKDKAKDGHHCANCGSCFIVVKNEALRIDKKASPELRDSGYRCPEDLQSLKRLQLENLEIEICEKCQRVWFDKDELGTFRFLYKGRKEVPIWKAHISQTTDYLSGEIAWGLIQVILEIIFDSGW
jgi:Zn-finger nucleic acid-binding protein